MIRQWNIRLRKRNGTLQFSSFYCQCRQSIESLIDATSSFSSPFKICADKIDDKNLKGFILDGLWTPLLKGCFWQFSLKSHICSSKKFYFEFLSICDSISSLSGLFILFEFLKLPKIAKNIDKFHAIHAIPYLNTCKSKFFSLNSRFSKESQFSMGQNQLSVFQKLREVSFKAENVAKCVKMIATEVKLRVANL